MRHEKPAPIKPSNPEIKYLYLVVLTQFSTPNIATNKKKDACVNLY